MSRVAVVLVIALFSLGCVTKGAYDSLSSEHEAMLLERDRLANQVERLTIERDSIEQQFVEAQESYENERVARTTLAGNLSRVQQKATSLDQTLDAERRAHMEAAARLAAREAEIAAMQSTYDALVSDLESEVSSGQIEIERLREGLRLNVSDEVLFDSGSAELDKIGRDVLVKVAGQLKELGDFIEVRGHTDDLPIGGALARRFPTNWELAAARAARVVRLLEERGVPGDRLAVVSLGPNDPVVPNTSADARARNRRIEIRLIPRDRPAPAAARSSSPSRSASPSASKSASGAASASKSTSKPNSQPEEAQTSPPGPAR